jgi:hypothetical protein
MLAPGAADHGGHRAAALLTSLVVPACRRGRSGPSSRGKELGQPAMRRARAPTVKNAAEDRVVGRQGGPMPVRLTDGSRTEARQDETLLGGTGYGDVTISTVAAARGSASSIWLAFINERLSLGIDRN